MADLVAEWLPYSSEMQTLEAAQFLEAFRREVFTGPQVTPGWLILRRAQRHLLDYARPSDSEGDDESSVAAWWDGAPDYCPGCGHRVTAPGYCFACAEAHRAATAQQEPLCTCERIAADLVDARGCELCNPNSPWNRQHKPPPGPPLAYPPEQNEGCPF